MKRVETNKLRGAFGESPKTLLLPLSLGVSSVCLLHVLNQQLAAQYERSGKAMYKLHVLFIDQAMPGNNAPHHEAFRRLQLRYPSHRYSSALLEDILDYDSTFDHESLSIRDADPQLTKQEHLRQVLSSLPSATSRADIEIIMRIRLTAAFAMQSSCHSVVWGDSTTRLAERTLAEAAKGRGGSLAWLTADGLSPYGIKFVYPMRDLLKKELGAFATLTSPPLTDMIIAKGSSAQVSTSSKITTIDDLMGQYFESVEENYPSIVANVVRTSARLLAPSIEPDEASCVVCGLPTVERSQKWGGDQKSGAENSPMELPISKQDGTLCYGCARSILDPSKI